MFNVLQQSIKAFINYLMSIKDQQILQLFLGDQKSLTKVLRWLSLGNFF